MIPNRQEILREPAGLRMDVWVAEIVMGWKYITQPGWDVVFFFPGEVLDTEYFKRNGFIETDRREN